MKKLGFLLVVLVFLISIAMPAVGLIPSISYMNNETKAKATSLTGNFAFVSEFTSGGTYSSYGWTAIGNPKPVITSKVNYYGEPSIEIFKNTHVYSIENVSSGGNFISFQAAIDAIYGKCNYINN